MTEDIHLKEETTLYVDHITSFRNPKIKNFQNLQKSKERKEQGLFVIEGLKEIEKASESGYSFDSVFYCPDFNPEQTVLNLKGINMDATKIYTVSKEIYCKIAYRENCCGVIVWAKTKKLALADLKVENKPLYLVVESVEKPGNLGALLRTADAAGLDGVIVCDNKTDVFNPNVIRSSIGCLFTVPLAVDTSENVINWLKSAGVSIYSAALSASVPYHTIDFKHASAIVMGTEATGLSDIWLKASDQNIIIPMRGMADSMNVSTSAAVLVYEALRQRGF